MNTTEPTFSIIVPVYNTPKDMLEKCVASLITQNGPYEYIFINDGSTDDSIHTIISEAMRLDKRIRYIEKENGGVSAARNDGIKFAQGKYLMFVDADDFLFEGALDYAYKKAEALNADVVLYGNNHREDAKGHVSRILTEKEKELLKKKVISFNAAYFDKLAVNIDAPWAKIFRKSIIEHNSIFFFTDIHRSEDAIFDLWCYEHSQIIAVDNKSIYSYESNPTSICHTRGIKEVRILPNIIKHEYDFINQCHRGSNDYLDALAFRTFKGVMDASVICFSQNPAKNVTEFRALLENKLIELFMGRWSYSMCKNINESLKMLLFRKKKLKTLVAIYYILSLTKKAKE